MNRELVSRFLTGEANIPTVIDADGLNSIAGTDFLGRGVETVLTPHPGEMGRLLGLEAAVKPDARLSTARQFAMDRNVCLVLKGFRTLIAFPDGKVWINPCWIARNGQEGGTGDVLTGLIAGLIGQAAEQVPPEIGLAVRAAVWLHGRAGELAADELTERCVLATDLLTYLPRAIRPPLQGLTAKRKPSRARPPHCRDAAQASCSAVDRQPRCGQDHVGQRHHQRPERRCT